MKTGLALEGGGARGAYEIGACKAIWEAGIKIDGIVGTSVGALNGALLVQGDLDLAVNIWNNISPAKVFNVQEEKISDLKHANLSGEVIGYFWEKMKNIFENRGLDTEPLKNLLNKLVDEEHIRNSETLFGIVTVSLTDRKSLELFKEDIPEGKLVEFLLASANFPAFKREVIDGKQYTDGGIYNNLPINMLIEKGYKDIIAIKLNAPGFIKKPSRKEHVRIRYIEPGEDLGSVLDFSQELARKNLKLGYYDARRMLEGLRGEKYYFKKDSIPSEHGFNTLSFLKEESIKAMDELLGNTGREPDKRLLFEVLIPKIAKIFDVEKDKGYEEILLKIIEDITLDYGLDRFRIYDFSELLAEVQNKTRYDKQERISKLTRGLLSKDIIVIRNKKTKTAIAKRLLKIIYSI